MLRMVLHGKLNDYSVIERFLMKKQQIRKNKNRLSDLESRFLLCGWLSGMDRKTSVCV
mgnify:CR=1 FL=1